MYDGEMTRRWTGLALLALLLAGLALRLVQLGTYLTPDERLWSQRTAQFMGALQEQDWPATAPTGHPGVTVMWSGTTGALLRFVLDRPSDIARLEDVAAALAAEPNRLDFVAWLRLPIALATAAAVLLFFWLARRLFGTGVALLASALLALDPFHLAHSRVLQMDALLATAVSIAWLAFLVGMPTGQRRYLVLGGVAAGLGFLTKAPALALGPAAIALSVWNALRPRSPGTQSPARRPPGAVVRILADLLWIAVPALAVVWLLWPAMWVAPLDTLARVWRFSTALGGGQHELGNFWLGEPAASPGLLFYPAVLLWRTTPVSLVGFGLAVFLLVVQALGRGLRRSENQETQDGGPGAPSPAASLSSRDAPVWSQQNTAAWAVLLFVIWFALFMSLGDKEFDRYLLPIFPLVDLLAAWGWLGVLAVVAARLNAAAGAGALRLATLVVVALVALQAITAIVHRPTYLTAYNPLVGGIRTARQVMLVGWGEGLADVARFLNARDGNDAPAVASWYGQNAFGPFYQGTSYDLYYDLPTAADLFAKDVAYVVTYVNQLQRDLLDPSIGSRLQVPIMSTSWQGVPLAEAYAWTKPFAHTTDRELSPGLRLLGWDAGPLDPDLRLLPIILYWDAASAAGLEANLPALVAWIKDGSGEVWATAEVPPAIDPAQQVTAWLDRQAIPQALSLQLPAGLPAGSYRLEVAPLNGQAMALGSATLPPDRRGDAEQLDVQRIPQRVIFGDTLQLVGYELVPESNNWQLDLLWDALAAPPEVKAFVHVVDASDTMIAQQDVLLSPLSAQPETTWTAGGLLRQRVRLQLPSSPPGSQLRVYSGLYHPETGERLALTVGDEPVPDGRYLLTTTAASSP